MTLAGNPALCLEPVLLRFWWCMRRMVIDAGDGITFWQLRCLFTKPSFTQNMAATAANCTDARFTDAEFNAQVGQQSEELPQLVGGGLGVPGSKARVLKMLADVGFDEVIPVVEVSLLAESRTVNRQDQGWVLLLPCTGHT